MVLQKKSRNKLNIGEILRSIWHKLERIKILSPLTEAIRFTNFYLVIVDCVDRLRQVVPDSKTVGYFEENKERIDKITSKLADEKSRQVYKKMIRFRCTCRQKVLLGIVDKNEYFDKDIINFGNKEIFVDCGAYNGDSIRSFLRHLKKYGGKFKKIIAFEPDKKNFEFLNAWAVEQFGGGMIT